MAQQTKLGITMAPFHDLPPRFKRRLTEDEAHRMAVGARGLPTWVLRYALGALLFVASVRMLT